MIDTVCQVFGKEVLQIDGFHVMQELNRGIKHDIVDFCNNDFRKQIQELLKLREMVAKVRKKVTNGSTSLAFDDLFYYSFEKIKIPIITCLSALKQSLSLITIINNDLFFARLKKFLSAVKKQSQGYFQTLVSRIESRLLKRHLTDKGRMRLINELL